MPGTALLVDDDAFVRLALERILRSQGFDEVIAASNGHEADAMLDRVGAVDLILLDLHMPGGDGIEFLRSLALRANRSPLILTSGYDLKTLRSSEALAQAHRLRLLGVLEKPICAEDIQELLDGGDRRVETLGAAAGFGIGQVRQALQSGQIVPWYQPVVSADGRRWVGMEALSRWRLEDDIVISPTDFVPIIEDHGLASELLMAQAERAMADLQHLGVLGFRPGLSLNLSAQSLQEIELPDRLAEVARRHGVDPGRVTFELTETLLIEQFTMSLDTLARLRLHGFRLSADDFGTGHATLSRLKLVPVTELKLDRSFVSRVRHDKEASAIVESCIGLARRLSLETVAEGIEDQALAGTLRDMGATSLQGYWVSRAMPAEKLPHWWRDWSSRPN